METVTADTRRQLLRDGKRELKQCPLLREKLVRSSGDGQGWRSGGEWEEYAASYDDEVSARTVL